MHEQSLGVCGVRGRVAVGQRTFGVCLGVFFFVSINFLLALCCPIPCRSQDVGGHSLAFEALAAASLCICSSPSFFLDETDPFFS